MDKITKLLDEVTQSVFALVAVAILISIIVAACATVPKTNGAPDIQQDADTVGKAAATVKENSEQTIAHADTWNAKSPAPEANKIKKLQTANIAEAGKLEIVQQNLNTAQTKIDGLEEGLKERDTLIEKQKAELESSNNWIWTIGIAGGFVLVVLGVWMFVNGNTKGGLGAGASGVASIILALVLQMWSVWFALIAGGTAAAGAIAVLIWLVSRRDRWVKELVRSGERMKKHIGDDWHEQEHIREDVGTVQSLDTKEVIARIRHQDQLTKKPLQQKLNETRLNDVV